MKKSRIIQLTPCITFGDAVSNDVFAMADVLSSHGFENYIVSIGIGEKIKDRVVPFHKFTPKPTDIFIFHMSIGSEMSRYVMDAKVKRKIMVYHNITPEEFYEGFPHVQGACRAGREELKMLAPHIDFSLADSDYNREELDELRYQNTATLPIVFDKSEYLNTKPSKKLLELYGDDDYTNILFVGRIAPNKKQEDVIQSFHLYNKYINPKSRLFLVGSSNALEAYKQALEDYISVNAIKNVYFSGHVSFPDIIAYYTLADVFLCESEHEGFCVPLLEAMTFDIPIIAYNSTAIPYTLGNGGIIFNEKDHRLVAELINLVASDENLRSEIISKQRERLAFFNIENTKKTFAELTLPWLD
ncbi:MAG: hypothetical protein PWQ76_236 [Clostridiales bacterium]|jgi:glycosyltransferase involved in cell wall biosynthesis|nr:mshA 1 [Oscillospiraceae bacterium]MDN5377983.1 hypothetical protein [Clostridiales bacterium]